MNGAPGVVQQTGPQQANRMFARLKVLALAALGSLGFGPCKHPFNHRAQDGQTALYSHLLDGGFCPAGEPLALEG